MTRCSSSSTLSTPRDTKSPVSLPETAISRTSAVPSTSSKPLLNGLVPMSSLKASKSTDRPSQTNRKSGSGPRLSSKPCNIQDRLPQCSFPYERTGRSPPPTDHSDPTSSLRPGSTVSNRGDAFPALQMQCSRLQAASPTAPPAPPEKSVLTTIPNARDMPQIWQTPARSPCLTTLQSLATPHALP